MSNPFAWLVTARLTRAPFAVLALVLYFGPSVIDRLFFAQYINRFTWLSLDAACIVGLAGATALRFADAGRSRMIAASVVYVLLGLAWIIFYSLQSELTLRAQDFEATLAIVRTTSRTAGILRVGCVLFVDYAAFLPSGRYSVPG